MAERPWYCTVEEVMSAPDIQFTARAETKIKQKIAAASDSIDGMCHRRFYPLTGTKYADWPSRTPGGLPWRIWLDGDSEIIELTSLSSGGTSIPLSAVLLEPVNDGPPYTELQIDLSSSSAFAGGDTYQRSIAMIGVHGYRADEEPAGELAAAISSTSATALTVSDASLVGVGSILRVDTERMIVTSRGWTTSAQTLQTPLTASAANVGVVVSDGTAFFPGEALLLDSERMSIVDIAGNTLTVKRAQDGSVLATHTGSTIYVSRALTVTRGALGTTAATHSSGADLARHVPPPLVTELAIAEATVGLLQAGAGYARVIGAGENQREARGVGLADLRKRCRTAHGLKARHYAV